jgi:cytochrome c-type biogenesis protein CcsB
VPVDQGLAHASDTLLFVGVVCYVLAMLCYFVEFAFTRVSPRPIAGGAVDTVPASYRRRVERASRPRGVPAVAGFVAVLLTVAGWAAHNGSVVTRGLAAHRVPWGNMYEFSSMVCLVAVTAFLWLLTRQRVRYLGGFVMLPVVLYLGLAGTVLYAPAAPLVPALNSYWIKIHVVGAMTSSGIFMVGFVCTVLYLARDSWERRRGAVDGGRLPSAAALDRVAYRVNAFAFPVWTFAVMAGAVWAEAAWGRYWGWDPKETWSFITWVIYAGYLHARATAGWKGRRAAYIAIAGFASLMVTYYAVNIWISGLHSYAGV